MALAGVLIAEKRPENATGVQERLAYYRMPAGSVLISSLDQAQALNVDQSTILKSTHKASYLEETREIYEYLRVKIELSLSRPLSADNPAFGSW